MEEKGGKGRKGKGRKERERRERGEGYGRRDLICGENEV